MRKKILVRDPEGKRQIVKTKRRREENRQLNCRKIGLESEK
jgi:hypothetical protein